MPLDVDLGRLALSRRRFLRAVAAGLGGLAAGGGFAAGAFAKTRGPTLPEWPFSLGVASGDPLSRRVVLWTRLAIEPLAPGLPPRAIPVSFEVADDELFRRPRRSGLAWALPQLGHSVHVDVGGLSPDRWYYYRFRTGDWVSDVGRTRTLPDPGSAPSLLRFATASCQNFREGFYTAYAHMAEEELDFVSFLGDYIYESGEIGPVRDHDGPRPTDLTGYRNRHALYRSDPNLQAAHRRFPWIVTWDDHEVSNNYAGLVPDENAPASAPPAALFPQIRAAAYQAWWEHMPVRLEPPVGNVLEIYRRFSFGDLLSLSVLDTRQHRTNQECGDALRRTCPGFPSPQGHMLGSAQEAWLLGGLGGSAAIWNALAQQVVFAPTPLGGFLNFDQWDGYPIARRRILDFVRAHAVRNFVVLTGDIHASAAGLVPFDTATLSDPVGSELVATGITSNIGDPGLADLFENLVGGLPHVRFFDAHQQGYIRHRVERSRWQADFRLVETIEEPTSPIATAASFVIADGVPGPEPA